jgi:hypothetical protein
MKAPSPDTLSPRERAVYSKRSLLLTCRLPIGPLPTFPLPICPSAHMPICPLPQCTGAVGAARSWIFFIRNMNGIMARKVSPSSQNVSV